MTSFTSSSSSSSSARKTSDTQIMAVGERIGLMGGLVSVLPKRTPQWASGVFLGFAGGGE